MKTIWSISVGPLKEKDLNGSGSQELLQSHVTSVFVPVPGPNQIQFVI